MAWSIGLIATIFVASYGFAKTTVVYSHHFGRISKKCVDRIMEIEMILILLSVTGIVSVALFDSSILSSPDELSFQVNPGFVGVLEGILVGVFIVLILPFLHRPFNGIYNTYATEDQLLRLRFTQQVLRNTVGCAVLLILIRELLIVIDPPRSYWTPFIVLGMCYIWVLSIQRPLFYVLADNIRHPTPNEKTRIENCYKQFGHSSGKIAIAEHGENHILSNIVTSEPRILINNHKRDTFIGIDSSFLEALNDEELCIILAQANEKNRLNLPTIEFVYTSAVTVYLIWLLSLITHNFLYLMREANLSIGIDLSLQPMTDFDITLFLLLAVVLLGCERYLRRYTYRADRFAAEIFGPRTVQTVYGTYKTELGLGNTEPIDLGVRPNIETRIDRLENRFPSTVDESES